MYMFGYVKVFTYICQEGMQIGQHINSNIHVCTQFAKIINTTSFLGLFGKVKQQQQQKTSSHLKKERNDPVEWLCVFASDCCCCSSKPFGVMVTALCL